MNALPDKLHLGCGLTAPDGWLNVDGSWNARLAKFPGIRRLLGAMRVIPRSISEVPWSRGIFIHNLTKPLPFPDRSFRAVYSSHTLEHLHLEDTQRLLRECHRVLVPGGVARMVVPDLRAFVEDYLGRRSVWWPEEPFVPHTAADRLNRNLSLRAPVRETGPTLHRLYRHLTEMRSHKWMYDADSLAYHMRQAGFEEVGERRCLESRIAGLEQVENAARLEDGQGVAVEGIKRP